jgi:hypothetical protein
MLLLF